MALAFIVFGPVISSDTVVSRVVCE